MRILLVEDNFLIAAQLKRVLSEMGCEVVGPVPSLEEGKELAESEELNGAILDINIVGGNSFPIATTLQDRGCPFFFITGYGSPMGLPKQLHMITRLNKPVDENQLHTVMAEKFTTN